MYVEYMYVYMTVHAKTSLVRTKIEIHFLAQLIATHISYLHAQHVSHGQTQLVCFSGEWIYGLVKP